MSATMSILRYFTVKSSSVPHPSTSTEDEGEAGRPTAETAEESDVDKEPSSAPGKRKSKHVSTFKTIWKKADLGLYTWKAWACFVNHAKSMICDHLTAMYGTNSHVSGSDQRVYVITNVQLHAKKP